MSVFLSGGAVAQGRYVLQMPNGSYRPIMGTLMARRTYDAARASMGNIFFWSFVLFWVSPVFFLMSLFVIALRYYTKIYDVFLFSKEAIGKYDQMLRPVTNQALFIAIGYRIYPEELEDHLRLVSSDEKKEMKELALKGKRMRKIPYRQFGLNVDRACRHIAIISTTGGGKTETIMSMLTTAVRNKSGVGNLDGKSDQMMEYKIYNLCKQEYYETQFYAIVLSKPEKNSESNTFSQLLSFESAAKTSEFMGEFIEGGEGGNADYFANRSKVMLGNVVMYFKNRQLYYNENFSVNDLHGAVKVTEINSIYYMAYGVIAELEDIIIKAMKEHSSFRRLMSKAKLMKTAQNDEIANSEALMEYVNQNPHISRELEQILGIKFRFFTDHYELFVSLDSYIFGISSTWGDYVRNIARALFIYTKVKEKKSFIYTHSSPIKITYIREIYEKMKNTDSEEYKAAYVFKDIPDSELEKSGVPVSMRMTAVRFSTFEKGMGLVAEVRETAENIEQDAVQQHKYSEQGWDRVFGLLKQYNRIFGASFPDVDGEDIVKNNKVLYIMLPVLELAPDQIGMLGKMFILMFKGIASIALGGDKQSATPIQFKIYQNRIKPNPLFIMVLDELGAYIPQNGLSELLSQVRSLRISMILSVQNNVSLDAPKNPNELKKIESNLAKMILEHKDAELKKLEDLICDVKMIESKSVLRSATEGHRVLENGTVDIVERKPFEISLATRFSKGAGVFIDKARDEPVIFQSYYLGDNAKQALQIRRFESYQSLMAA